MEIYNESVRDLLIADTTPLRLLDDPEVSVHLDVSPMVLEYTYPNILAVLTERYHCRETHRGNSKRLEPF